LFSEQFKRSVSSAVKGQDLLRKPLRGP